MLSRKLPRIRKLPQKHFNHFEVFVPCKQAAASTEGRKLSGFHEASTIAFREAFRSSFHEKLEATYTEFYVLLPWKLPQLPRNLSGFHDSSQGYICIVHYCASIRAYHFFDNMVDAHCVRVIGGFTVRWLVVAFHWVWVRVRARVYIIYRVC